MSKRSIEISWRPQLGSRHRLLSDEARPDTPTR